MAPDDDENDAGLDLGKPIKVTGQRRKKKRAEDAGKTKRKAEK